MSSHSQRTEAGRRQPGQRARPGFIDTENSNPFRTARAAPPPPPRTSVGHFCWSPFDKTNWPYPWRWLDDYSAEKRAHPDWNLGAQQVDVEAPSAICTFGQGCSLHGGSGGGTLSCCW